MWFRKGLYVTINSEVKYPSNPWCQVQGGVTLTETKYGGWGSYGTASAVEGLRPQRLGRRRLGIWAYEGRNGQIDMEEDVNKQEREGEVVV